MKQNLVYMAISLQHHILLPIDTFYENQIILRASQNILIVAKNDKYRKNMIDR